VWQSILSEGGKPVMFGDATTGKKKIWDGVDRERPGRVMSNLSRLGEKGAPQLIREKPTFPEGDRLFTWGMDLLQRLRQVIKER